MIQLNSKSKRKSNYLFKMLKKKDLRGKLKKWVKGKQRKY